MSTIQIIHITIPLNFDLSWVDRLAEIITIRGSTNNYLLKSNDGYLLVDLSMPHDFRRFQRKLRKLKINISEINYLFLTHSHADHSGYIEQFLLNSSAKLIVHENTLPHLYNGTMESESLPVNFYYKIMRKFADFGLKHGFQPLTIGDERIITIKTDDEKLLEVIGIKGKIITTFGHTKDSITLILDEGIAFTGDTCSNRSTFYFGKGKRPAFIVDEVMLMESWKKLVNHRVKMIYPAHGKIFPIEDLGLS